MPCVEGELLVNLDVIPGEAADEAAMNNAVRVWATVEDEDYVVEAIRGDAAEEITARLAGTHIDADSEEEEKKEEDDGDENTGRGRGAPPAYAELSSCFGVLERVARRRVGMETPHFTCRKSGWRSSQRMPLSERARQT